MHGKSKGKEMELGINDRMFLRFSSRDGLSGRGAGLLPPTGFRLVCIKNVFRTENI